MMSGADADNLDKKEVGQHPEHKTESRWNSMTHGWWCWTITEATCVHMHMHTCTHELTDYSSVYFTSWHSGQGISKSRVHRKKPTTPTLLSDMCTPFLVWGLTSPSLIDSRNPSLSTHKNPVTVFPKLFVIKKTASYCLYSLSWLWTFWI